ncbi:resolvase [Lactobacillus crispatus]|nr:resolvase [Lactobacillus crispatus]
MKANQVMEILQISRSTLKRYREKGFIKAVQKPTGQFEFDDDSVWLFKNKHTPRQTILYGRVSTYKQKHDLAIKCKNYVISLKIKAIMSIIPFQILPVASLLKIENSSLNY